MPTVTLNVELNTTANPPVIISNRQQTATSGSKIRWQKKDNNDNFDITTLAPTGTGEAFSTATTGGSGQWLETTFSDGGAPAGTDFPYTLTVSSGGTNYNSTQVEPEPDNGRPVIRN